MPIDANWCQLMSSDVKLCKCCQVLASDAKLCKCWQVMQDVKLNTRCEVNNCLNYSQSLNNGYDYVKQNLKYLFKFLYKPLKSLKITLASSIEY